MSAFSALFGNSKKDDALTDLLLLSAGPIARPIRPRTVFDVPDEVKESESDEESADEDEQESEETGDESVEDQPKKSKKRSRSEDDHDSLERDHLAKLTGTDKETEEKKSKKSKKQKKAEKKETDENDADSDEKDSEQTDSEKKSSKGRAAKTVDLKAEELEKAGRTVFVGNVSNSVITSKSTYKKFKKLFAAVGSVDSIRFRSIAFDEALPRKVAFVKKALHDTRDTLNAYVVFKEEKASRKAPQTLNATTFEDFHIRVDHVSHPSPKDNKRTIFVGNLDFEEQEENLWKYFNSKTGNDVESVRVVRDAKTNLGKGFALVQFKDSLSVNKALLLNDKPMAVEEGKKSRKLRILRAKSHAKPSIISPNHYVNQKKTLKPPRNLNDDQETKLGRAKRLLGKADRNTAGRMVVEGARATKGLKIEGIKGLKSAKGKAKKPRITKRSLQFKKDRNEFKNLN